jgi:hypothetical protein
MNNKTINEKEKNSNVNHRSFDSKIIGWGNSILPGPLCCKRP